jgi:hypothetical protein
MSFCKELSFVVFRRTVGVTLRIEVGRKSPPASGDLEGNVFDPEPTEWATSRPTDRCRRSRAWGG